MAKLAIQASIPTSIIHVVPTKAHQESLKLVKNPKVKKLSFTGSTRVSKILTHLADRIIRKVSIQLGGNTLFIIFDNPDLDRAVEGTMASKFRYAGQTCVVHNNNFSPKIR